MHIYKLKKRKMSIIYIQFDLIHIPGFLTGSALEYSSLHLINLVREYYPDLFRLSIFQRIIIYRDVKCSADSSCIVFIVIISVKSTYLY